MRACVFVIFKYELTKVVNSVLYIYDIMTTTNMVMRC